MKKLLFILAVAGSLVACNNNATVSEVTDTTATTMNTDTGIMYPINTDTTDLDSDTAMQR